MAIRPKDIYRGGKKSRARAGAVILVILAVLTAAVLLFYWLRQYAVYDENGNATLIPPFSQKRDNGGDRIDPAESEGPSLDSTMPDCPKIPDFGSGEGSGQSSIPANGQSPGPGLPAGLPAP
jgi:hypothetical protein